MHKGGKLPNWRGQRPQYLRDTLHGLRPEGFVQDGAPSIFTFALLVTMPR